MNLVSFNDTTNYLQLVKVSRSSLEKHSASATCLSKFQSHELHRHQPLEEAPRDARTKIFFRRRLRETSCGRCVDCLSVFPLVQWRVWISRIFLRKGLFGGTSRLPNNRPTTPMNHWMIFGGTLPITSPKTQIAPPAK